MKKAVNSVKEPEIAFLAIIQRIADETEGGGKVTFSVPETELAPFLELWTKRGKVLEVHIREH